MLNFLFSKRDEQKMKTHSESRFLKFRQIGGWNCVLDTVIDSFTTQANNELPGPEAQSVAKWFAV